MPARLSLGILGNARTHLAGASRTLWDASRATPVTRPPPCWFTLQEAARAARCGRATILGAIQRRELSAKLSGVHWIIRPDVLAAWRRERRRSGSPGHGKAA